MIRVKGTEAFARHFFERAALFLGVTPSELRRDYAERFRAGDHSCTPWTGRTLLDEQQLAFRIWRAAHLTARFFRMVPRQAHIGSAWARWWIRNPREAHAHMSLMRKATRR